MEPKKYGLIIPKKEKKEIVNKVNLFSKDNSDEELTYAKPKLTSISQKDKFIKKQAQLNIEKALNEDPNCFEYDNVYEDMQAKKFSAKTNTIKDKKPKYIEKLMQTAQERKREYERRVERQVQRDREAEKGMFDDKEAYVTDAYKKKMQMLKEEEEMERKKQLLEEQQDVTKKRDFSDFYRHILEQQTGGTYQPDIHAQIKKETKEPKSSCASADDGNLISTPEININTDTKNNRTQNDSVISADKSLDDDDVDDDDDASSDNSDDDVIDIVYSNKETVVDANVNEMTSSKDASVENKPKHDKHTVGESLSDARARYLARKNQTCVPVYDNS